jgi:plasmid stabilization system protein ParE
MASLNISLPKTLPEYMKYFTEFVVFYRPVDKGIEIVRVVHGSRNLPRFEEAVGRKR